MELALNLVWAATALAMLAAWLRMPKHEHASRMRQAMCLGVAVLLLLPVISLSDDLVAAQMTTELDVCVRRAHDGHAHQPHLCTTACTLAYTAPFAFRAMRSEERISIPAARVEESRAFLHLPFSRPPPVAG